MKMVKIQIQTLLRKLGFKYITADLWRHEFVGIISVEDGETPDDIVKKIYMRGHGECQLEIRTALGIEG